MNCFKLSPRTKIILSHFSRVQPSLLFTPGQEIRTISPEKDIIAVAKITETIPATFGIYSLRDLLKTISAFDDPILLPHESYLEIKGTDGECYEYRLSPEKDILHPP